MYGTELIKAIGTNKLDKLTPYEMDTGENRRIPTELFPSMINSWNDDGGVTDANAFTIAELQIATQSMKVGKAAGSDRISPEAIKIAADALPDWILAIMNKILEIQEFPEAWKVAGVVLIHKQGKPADLSSSHKPLCMLNTMNKLLETLIRNRVNKEVEERGGLHKHQYGFRKGRSTVDALEKVMEFVRECDSRWVVLVTIDVWNAFNSAYHSLIIG